LLNYVSMKKISSKEIQQLINEIVTNFSSIDHKVLELTHVSNDDFSALNKIMKDHHKTTHEIGKSTVELIERVESLKENQALQKLRNANNSLKSSVKKSKGNLIEYTTQANRLNHDFKHIFIPILNFKQNISTLKFLLTNLKLNQGLIGKKAHTETKKLIEDLTTKIEQIQVEIPVIAKDVDSLKDNYSTAIEKAASASRQIEMDLAEDIETINKHILFIEKGIKKSKSIKSQVEQKNQEGFQNLNMIITNLQYHDIIRQKIEHIQDTHKNILDELNTLEKQENIIQQGLKYIKQIPGITEIQAGQLILTNKEYQGAIENISKKLLDTSNTMEDVNNLSFSIFQTNESDFTTKSIEKNTKSLNDKIFAFSKNIAELLESNKKLQESIKLHDQHYKKLEQIESDITAIINKIKDHLAEESDIKTITNKLISLQNDIVESRSNIGKIINSHKNNFLIQLIIDIDKHLSILENNAIESQDLWPLFEEFNQINEKIKNNCKSYKAFDSELKNTLGNIKYYDFYEHQVEEIINQLNSVYKKILPISEQGDINNDLLISMKSAYTMQSQRDIHDHTNSEGPEEDDDNLELF
jgi:chromosome segregation ATPase